MSQFDLTLIRKKLAKDLGKSAGLASQPVKGPFDVPIHSTSKGRYIKFAFGAVGIVLAVGFVSYLLDPDRGRDPALPESKETAAKGGSRLALDRLANLPATPAVSAPMKPEPGEVTPPIELKGVEHPGFYVQIAAYRGHRFLQSAQQRVSELGFEKEMVVKETFWTPQFIRVVTGADEGSQALTKALGGIRPALPVQAGAEHSFRVGPIYYSNLLSEVQNSLSKSGIRVDGVEVAEQELIYLLLLGPYESEASAETARARVQSYARDAFVLWEKGAAPAR